MLKTAIAVNDIAELLGALFSGIALIFVAKSIKNQNKDSKLAQELHKKQFLETSFFQLLQFNNEIKSNTNYYTNGNYFLGLNAFRQLKEELYQSMLQGDKSHHNHLRLDTYEGFYLDKMHDITGHYFRNLYHIIKLVDTSEVENKTYYAKLLRAQLSSNELYLLFYNGLSKYGRKKLKPLLTKYAFFEHMPLDAIIDDTSLSNYSPKAFGTSEEWSTKLSQLQCHHKQ